MNMCEVCILDCMNEGYLLLIGLPFANEVIQFRANTIYSLACPVLKKIIIKEKKERKRKQQEENAVKSKSQTNKQTKLKITQNKRMTIYCTVID